MLRIDAAQQFALVEPEGDAVISLPRARFPHGFLTGQHDCQAIEVDSLLALLRELRREYGRHDGQQESDHRLVIAQPSAADWTVPSRPELRERRGHVRDVRRQQRVDVNYPHRNTTCAALTAATSQRRLQLATHTGAREANSRRFLEEPWSCMFQRDAVRPPSSRELSDPSSSGRRGLSDAVRHGLAAKPTECFHAAVYEAATARSPCDCRRRSPQRRPTGRRRVRRNSSRGALLICPEG